MKPTNLEWEDVIQFEEVEGYGKSIWKNEDKYYLVSEEGTVASWLDRKSTRLNSSHSRASRMPSSA